MLIHPSGQASPDSASDRTRSECKRVKDQLIHIDDTMTAVNFEYTHADRPIAWRTSIQSCTTRVLKTTRVASESAGKSTPTNGANNGSQEAKLSDQN